MKYVTKEVTSEATVTNNSNQIDWNDFNYPVCLKVFHFNQDETPDIHKRKVRLLWLNHILILLANLLNIIANIAGAAQGYACLNLEYRKEDCASASVSSSFSSGSPGPSSCCSCPTTSS